MSTGEFTDRVALVTGSSRGIGAATARLPAERGAKVVVNYRSSAEEAEAVADEIRDAGGEALVVRADVREADAVERMVETTLDEWGTVDVLVNNANVTFAKKPLAEMTWAEFSQRLNDELKAAFTVSKAVLPVMADREYGRAVYVSSGLGDHPSPGFVAHAIAALASDDAQFVTGTYTPVNGGNDME